MSWIDYWDGAPTIYVSDRHRLAHYRAIANGIAAHVGRGDGIVLDYGCGEALDAARLAPLCRRLYLHDAAPSVEASLRDRFESVDNITVLSATALAGLRAGSVDLIVANSVIQYLDDAALTQATELWKRLLAPGGAILLADIVPRSIGPLTDAAALLHFAARQGFLVAAMAGLVRTFFSDYRQLRARLGLRQMDEAEAVAALAAHGLEARRIRPNLGHNQARMAFLVTVEQSADASG
jgi:SAM-dependent methyltransferase